jgi:hypothetical protein
LYHVSCSPSKIPYVGFSPVRLQTGIHRRPSPILSLYVDKVAVSRSYSLFRHSIGVILTRQSRPEALGSPTSYVVPQGQRLLWPHPSLSNPSHSLFSSSVRDFEFERVPPFICLPFPSCHLQHPGGPKDCSWLFLHLSYQPSPSLHRLGIRFVPNRRFSGEQRNEAASSSLPLRPEGLLALLRQGLLLSSFHLLSRLIEASNITTRVNNLFP